MTQEPHKDYELILRDGINAAKIGNKNLAWSLLNQVAQMNPLDARPWIWLTEATDDHKEKREYLEQALAADPRNPIARRGLAALGVDIKQQPSPSMQDGVTVQASDEPILAQSKEIFLCPKCGGHLEYDIRVNELTCRYCGHVNQTEERSAADNEQVMAHYLPTEKGHRWAASQHQLVCGQCGAHSLWSPGQAAAQCPYCGSGQLMESQETEGLVDPQAIAIMQVNEKEATRKIIEWLGKGWTAPDDLKGSARKSLLRPAYYPFWTFDGTLDIHWSCETNDGSTNKPNWVSRSGTEYEMFDDVLIPGLTSLKFKDLYKLGVFNLKDVIEFKPEFLAGWPALTYDRPLAKATLLAREQIVKRVRPQLHGRVLPGQQKRGLNTGGLNWSDMTFKHVLLPVWIGSYRYKGQDYKIMVNGQTGKVAGEKPRDTFKMFGIIFSVVATIIVILIIVGIIAVSQGWISL
jgi:DNA-directed RNA polymerase subunit RPC12/RpoP